MRSWSKNLGTLLVSMLSVAAANAAFVPQSGPIEQKSYQELVRTDPAAAKSYMDTRNYVRICSQGLEQPTRILEIGIQPDDYNDKYTTPGEAKMVKQAIFLWMKATVAH